MDLTELIISAEKQYKAILEGFFQSVYDESRLPSHGINHHRRVWIHAKELMVLFDNINGETIKCLIIAAYLHDIGMCEESGPRHGWKSSELCRDFLMRNNLKETDFQGLLDAITEHDNKEYLKSSSSVILNILSMADDLDAFGYIGIYRYLEIYLQRGIPLDSVSKIIRSNASARFMNFEKNLPSSGRILEKHRSRYLILDDFFKSIDNEHDLNGPYHQSLNIILTSINGNGLPENLSKINSNNNAVRVFTEGFKKELL